MLTAQIAERERFGALEDEVLENEALREVRTDDRCQPTNASQTQKWNRDGGMKLYLCASVLAMLPQEKRRKHVPSTSI